MNVSQFSVATYFYIASFAGCYLYFVWDLPHRYPRIPAALTLVTLFLLVFEKKDATFSILVVRYAQFALLYTLWSVIFLRIRPQYALYLSVFFTIFMCVWLSCIQVAHYILNIDLSLLAFTTCIFRVLSIVLLKRFFVKIDADRSITLREMLLSLFPSIACLVANLLIYDQLGLYASAGISLGALYFAVLFFGFSALLVLINSEVYFRLMHYRAESKLAQEQLQTQYQLFLQKQEGDEKLRALRHDLRNHLDTIEAMTQASDIKAYIANLRGAEIETQMAFSTGCSTLDAVLATKMSTLRENHIELSCLAHLTLDGYLTQMEICTLFSNSLDNAIEAIVAGDIEPESRIIVLSCAEINDHLVVRIENPYRHELIERNGLLLTTKLDTQAHGYGISNMRRIVESHGGTMTQRAENGTFMLFFSIPIALDNKD